MAADVETNTNTGNKGGNGGSRNRSRSRYLPAILHRNRAPSTKHLREKFRRRFPFLKAFHRRRPSVPIPQRHTNASHGDVDAAACAASAEKALAKDENNALKLYVLEIDKEYNRVEKELRIVTHGIDEYGNVVRAEFRNFYPYLFASFPTVWGWCAHTVNDAWITRLRDALESAMRELIHGDHIEKTCLHLALAAKLDGRRLIRDMRLHWNVPACYFDCDRPVPMLKIECLHWKLIPVLRRVCENPFGQNGIDASAFHDFVPAFKRRVLPNWVSRYCPQMYRPAQAPDGVDRHDSPALHTWEADKDYTMVFHGDKQVCCSSWWHVWGAQSASAVNYNVDACYVFDHDRVRPIAPHEPLTRVIPDDFVFYFDLETMKLGGKAGFPRAELGDPINQIGFQIQRMEMLNSGMSISEAARKGLFFAGIMTIKPVRSMMAAEHDDAEINYRICALNCESELDMLIGFEEMLVGLNPTVYIHYNGNSFDWPYLIRRMRMLRSKLRAKEAAEDSMHDMNINSYFAVGRDFRFGKGVHYRKAKKRGVCLAASAKQDTDKVFITGCQNLDLLCFVRQHKKFGLKGFSLDMVSAKFLGVQKLDIDHSRMYHMFMNPVQRQYVARYCDRDVVLMVRLVMAFDKFRFLRDISNMTMISWQKLIDRGAQCMILGLWCAQHSVRDLGVLYQNKHLYACVESEMRERVERRNCRAQDSPPRLIIPSGTFMVRKVEGPRMKSADQSFDGAVMVEPVIGWYMMTMTLDFEALYPNIMKAMNIGPSTEVPHFMKRAVMQRAEELCRRAHVPTNDLYYERTDNWYCTGERSVPMSTLEEALHEFEKEQPMYDENVRTSLRADYQYLTDAANKEYVEKWIPLAFGEEPNATAEECATLSDDDKVAIFIDVVQRACRLSGRTKTRTRRADMPHFVQSIFREGVYAHAERTLGDVRSSIKREMATAKREVQQLLHDGVAKSDPRVKNGLLRAREYDVRQQAVKLIMNAVYGILPSMWKMKFTAECVTDAGRMLIEETVAFSDTMITPALGYLSKLKTTYGDTDSAFETFVDIRYQEQITSLSKKLRMWPVIEERGTYALVYAMRVGALKRQVAEQVQAKHINEKNASKVSAFIAWKRLLHDCFERSDMPKSLFYVPRANRTSDYTPFAIDDDELELYDYLMHYYDYVLERVIGCSNVLRCVPNECHLRPAGTRMNPPPLPTAHTILSAKHVLDALEWIFCQIYIEEGEKIARVVNGYYQIMYKSGYIVQEFEKLYLRILMTRKKKYGGQIYLPGAAEPVCDVKGLTSVRGDSYTVKSYLCDELLSIAVREGDIDKCELHALSTLRRLAKREVPPYMLIQSKGVKRHPSAYGEEQPPGLRYLVPTKGMATHIRASLLRNLLFGEDVPAVDTRYRFIVAEAQRVSKTGKVSSLSSAGMPVWKRIVPAHEVLRHYGDVRYDISYYSANLIKLIANMLSPVFHSSTFDERYADAERFRRMRDKEARSKAVSKYFEKSIRQEVLKRLNVFLKHHLYSREPISQYAGFLRSDVRTIHRSSTNNGSSSSIRHNRQPSATIAYDDEERDTALRDITTAQLKEIDKIADALLSNDTAGGDDEQKLKYSYGINIKLPDEAAVTSEAATASRKRTRKEATLTRVAATKVPLSVQLANGRAKTQKRIKAMAGDERTQGSLASFFKSSKMVSIDNDDNIDKNDHQAQSQCHTVQNEIEQTIASSDTTNVSNECSEASEDIECRHGDENEQNTERTSLFSYLKRSENSNMDDDCDIHDDDEDNIRRLQRTCEKCGASIVSNEEITVANGSTFGYRNLRWCLSCKEKKERVSLQERYDKAIRDARSSAVTKFAKTTSFLCLACQTNRLTCTSDGEPECFCGDCVESGAMRVTLYALNRYLSPLLVEQANICSTKCGDTRSVGNPDDIVDIELAAATSDRFFERNQDLKSCMTVGCPNIWHRAESQIRRRAIEYINRRYS